MAEVRALQQVERGSRSGLFHDVEGVFIIVVGVALFVVDWCMWWCIKIIKLLLLLLLLITFITII